MNRILISMTFLIGLHSTYGQELKTITNRTSQTVEEYEVLKADKKNKNGKYIKKTAWGQLITKGQFKDNIEAGLWEFYDYRTGDLEQKFDYDNNKIVFLNLESTAQNHFYYNGQWILDKLDTVPFVIGGLSNLRLKLVETAYSYTKAPNFPKAGVAIFSFIVTKEGKTKDFKISQSSENSFEKRLLNIIESSMENWRPGIYKGEAVDTEFLIPMNVRYKINSPDQKEYIIEFDYPRTR
jgi:hypothetical protein